MYGQIKAFFKEDDGIAVVELLLILVILVAAVLIFKKQILSLVEKILSKITSQSNTV